MKYPLLALALSMLTLAVSGCGSSRQVVSSPSIPTVPSPIAHPTASILGAIELTMDANGQGELKTQSARLSVQAVLPDNAISFKRLYGGSLDDDSTGLRHLFVTFEITNQSSTPFQNLTLTAYSQAGTAVGGTAFKGITNFGGGMIGDVIIGRVIKPEHSMVRTATGLKVDPNAADFQAITSSEAAALQTAALSSGVISAGSEVLEYGFVARNTTGGRTIAANGGKGQITIALTLPKRSDINEVPFRFDATWLLSDEAITRVTRGPGETTAEVVSRAGVLGGNVEVMFLGGDSDVATCTAPTACTTDRRADLRTSTAPTFLFDSDGVGSGDGGGGHPGHATQRPSLETLRNLNPLFRKHESASRSDLLALGFAYEDFTELASRPDNGPQPTEGQFRISCQWSHFGYNDPIIKPGKPGEAHLHMFWGNTGADAYSVSNVPSNPSNVHELAERGGGTCQAFELNRSSYWMPALLDSVTSPRNVVIPNQIVIYYKSKSRKVKPLPRGLQLLGGNVSSGGVPGATFQADPYGQYYDLFWSCGSNGNIYNAGSSIPTDCKAGDSINATIRFPQCIAVDANNQPILSSSDHLSHAIRINDQQECPASHPYRITEISYLVYFPNGSDGAGAGVAQWRLSSDMGNGVPGGSLHGDWFGGWNDEAVKIWHEGCINPPELSSDPRNCSQGQTGTSRSLRRVSPLNDYSGPNFKPLPE
jgi:Domain of unknown function (DUF1996)